MTNDTLKQFRAVIYTRVSSDEQVKGYGLEYQLEDCRRAIAQHNHQLIDVYSDPGVSGTLEDRPDLNRLRADAQSKKFDIVYFWKSDRLARDEIIQLTLYREFKRLGIETYSVSEPNMNDLMRGIYAVFGAEDLRNIKSKMYSGRIRAIKAGKWIGSPPYGYVKDTNYKLQIEPTEARWVKTLFEWFVGDRMSLKGLVKRAHRHGVPTRYDRRQQQKPRNGHGYWSMGTLGRLLTRTYYATGEAVWRVRPELTRIGRSGASPPTEEVRVAVPPIVSLELVEAARQQLNRNREYARRRAKRTYLFAKKLRCSPCGIKLSGSCKGERLDIKYYRGDAGCRETRCRACRYYSEVGLDAILWPQILRLFRTPEQFIRQLERYRQRDSRLPNLEADRKALSEFRERVEEQQRSLLDHELEGFYSAEVLAKKRAELRRQRAEVTEKQRDLDWRGLVEANRMQAASSAAQLYNTLREKIEAPTYAIKAEVYRILIDRILLDREHAEVWLNVPTDVTPGSVDSLLTLTTETQLIPRTPSMDSDAIDAGISANQLIERSSYIECVANEEGEPPRASQGSSLLSSQGRETRRMRSTPGMECDSNDGGGTPKSIQVGRSLPVIFQIQLTPRVQRAA